MKKRVLSAALATTMVWSTLAMSAMAEVEVTPDIDVNPATSTEQGEQGVASGIGSVLTKQHRENFRVLVPVDKQIYEFVLDPAKNSKYSNAINETNADGTPSGYTKQTVYFNRLLNRTWCGVALPSQDLLSPLSFNAGNWTLSNRSEFLVVTNIGSTDVDVNAQVIVPPNGRNDDCNLRASLVAYAYNGATAADPDNAATNGWQMIQSPEYSLQDEGVTAIVGAQTKTELGIEPDGTGNDDVYVTNVGVADNNIRYVDNTSGIYSDPTTGEDTDRRKADTLDSIKLYDGFQEVSVRLVRENGHQLPESTTFNGKTWRVRDQKGFYDDELKEIAAADRNAALMQATNSVAFQVEADAEGAGWSQNSRAEIKIVWTVTAQNAKIPTMTATRFTFDNNNVGNLAVTADAGQGSLKATGVRSVSYMYGNTDHRAEMVLDSNWYTSGQVNTTNNLITITLLQNGLQNIVDSELTAPGQWLPAEFKVVFNLEDGGTSEAYFWIY